MRTIRPSAPPITGSIGYPLGFAAGIIVTAVAVAADATSHPQRAMIALAGTAALLASITTLRAALATAAVCWALDTGFVLNRHGDLVLTVPAVQTAALLAATTLTVYAIARRSRRPRQD